MNKIISSSKYRLNWYKIVLFSVAIVLTGNYSITVKGQAVVPLTVNATVNAADKQSDAVTALTANTGTTESTLSVSTEIISLDYSTGSHATFNITSNTNWNISKGDSASWLDISPFSGSNNGTITLTTNSTNTGAARIATIIIGGTGVAPKTLTVIQQYQEIITNFLGNGIVLDSISTTESRKAQAMWFHSSGEIESISIYHNGGTGNVLLGVYSDHLGTPSTLLGVTALTPVNKSKGWQTVKLTSPLNLFSGQKIWLSWVFDVNPGIRYSDKMDGSPQAAESPATWPEGLPLNFGTSTTSNIRYSIYCTYKQKPLTLSTTSISLGYGKGSRGSFNIYSNTNWFIKTPGLWIEAVPQEGSNNGLITFITNEENTGPSPITKTVLITSWGHYISKAISVTQECKPSSAKTIGNTAVYNLISTTPNRKAQPITFNEAGEIESISVYHNGGTGNVILGIYSDQAGTPSSLLGKTTSTPINLISGWQTVSLSSPVTVTSGQTIWLSCVFETNPGIRYMAGLPPITESFETWSGSMPTNFGQADYSYSKYSIYCSFTPTSVKPTLSLSTQNITLGSDSGSSGTFNITSNTVWSNGIDDFFYDDRYWLSMSPPPTRSIDNGTITVTTNSANTGIIPRIAKVFIGYLPGNEIVDRILIVKVTQDCQANATKNLGKITYQVWNNIGSSTKVSSLTGNVNYPNYPTSSTLITSMEGTTDLGNSYGARIVGYIHAPATGSYTFWIASDDYGELWLSTNDEPGNKHKIAYVSGYTWIKEWNKYPSQKSVAINLVQGQKYYIEALMKEGTGKDNLAVGWLKPGESGSVPSEIIPGSVLSPFGTIPIISVTLPHTLFLNTGGSVLLPATVLPANATVKTLNWTVSDPKTVALVNSNGIVTGISEGCTLISATSTDGSYESGTCEVIVSGVPTICSGSGNINYQVWNNIGSGLTVSSLTSNLNYPDNPTFSTLITSMEATNDHGDNYGARITGYICAPATGSYTFWIASDDYGELWLSTNDDPANKYKIAYVNGYTWIKEWNKYPSQKSVTINLFKGQKYYIEALMKEATGKDNLAVGWLKPGETGTVPSEIIPGSVLSPFGTIPVNSVTLPPVLDLNTGASVLLPATVLPANATVKTLNWTTSDPTVALVNSSGVVTCISAGIVTISATSADGSNKSGTCVVTVSGVPSICSATGNITYQVWNNIGISPLVSSLTGNANYPDNPTSGILINSMEGSKNLADNYGARIVGYICAPATGSYTFWIASDDYGELWLSTNDDPINKHRIAYVNGYTWIRDWNKYASQKSVIINMVQGQKYYIEALMKEATGHDNLVVGWLKPGETGSIPSEVIPGSVLSPLVLPGKKFEVEFPAMITTDVTLLVYPNPLINDLLNINLENLSTEAILRIYTISGVQNYEEIIQGSGVIKIDRSVFKSGIYIIKVETEDFVKTAKLVVN